MAGLWHDHKVRERAYDLWERSGRPDGKDAEHWLQAEAEIAAEEQGLNEEIELEKDGVI